MKRTLLLAIMLVFAGFLSQAQVLLDEDFSSGTFPPSGWSISDHAANWSAVATANAGGQAPEVRLNWAPQFNATSRLESPALDLSGNESGLVSISFRHMVDHYGGPYQIGLAYSNNGGDWQTIWNVSPTANIPAQVMAFQLDADDFPVNSDNVKIGLFFSGSSYNINYWYIDDVKIVLPLGLDLAMSELLVPDFFVDDVPVTGVVENMGMEEIFSFDLNWQINDGTVYTENFSGLSIPFGSSYNFETEGLIESVPGSYTISVYVSNVNGQESDDNADNDMLQKTFSVPSGSVAYRPLFESFSSSTCPPCAPFNTGVMNPFVANNIGNMSIIKYQMSWPAPGDPYYTPEGGIRRVYYGVNAVPSLVVDGSFVATNQGAVDNAFQAGLSRQAFMELSGTSSMDGTIINVDVEILPYLTLSDLRLHVVVVEKTTYDNATSNGETEFHYVMMKMIPDAEGTTINLTDGEAYNNSFSMDLSGTNIEEFDDLAVVLFIQDHPSRMVFQSAFTAHDEVFTIDFDIDNLSEGIELDGVVNVSFSGPVTFTDGSEITNTNVHELITYTSFDKEGSPVPFTASISEDKKSITIAPDELLDYNTQYFVEIASVMGPGGFITEPVSIVFTTRTTYGAPVTTFDVIDDGVDVPVDHVFTIEFNQPVRHADGSEITFLNIGQLITFRENDLQGDAVAFTATINTEKTAITVDPLANLAGNQLFVLGVGALMGIDNEVSDPVHISFTTQEALFVNEFDPASINIYPNPAHANIFIELPQVHGDVNVRLFHINGQLVYDARTQGSTVKIDSSQFSAGIYFVEIIADGKIARRKVTVAH
ncbi:MAG: Ig-like domain-containing protein [Bacteroidales bacterium]|nr:Ig-like domain-containing protein [Bacteroidales bacterium]